MLDVLVQHMKDELGRGTVHLDSMWKKNKSTHTHAEKLNTQGTLDFVLHWERHS